MFAAGHPFVHSATLGFLDLTRSLYHEPTPLPFFYRVNQADCRVTSMV